MTRPVSPYSAPRFEIVDERQMPRRRSKRATSWQIGALVGAVRAVIESGYVSLANAVMVRAEQLEDARAGRGHAKRERRAERQRRRQARKSDPSNVAAQRAPTPSAPIS